MSESTLSAHCVRCKTTRPVQDAQPIYLANGRPATRACPVRGTALAAHRQYAARRTAEPEPAASCDGRFIAPEGEPHPLRRKAGRRPAVRSQSILSGSTAQVSERHKASRRTYRPPQNASHAPDGAGRRRIACAARRCACWPRAGRSSWRTAGPRQGGVCPECGVRLFRIGATADRAICRSPRRSRRVRGKAASAKDKATAAKGKSTPAPRKSAGGTKNKEPARCGALCGPLDATGRSWSSSSRPRSAHGGPVPRFGL